MPDSRWISRSARGLVLLAAVSLIGSGCLWTPFRGGPARTGSTTDAIINTTNLWTLGEAWTASTGGGVESSPAVDNLERHVLYVGSNDGNLYAFDSLDGTGLWTGPTGGAVRSSPAIGGDVVYVGSDDGNLYAFDADGAAGCSGDPTVCDPLWTAPIGGAVRSSPAVVDGIVYIGADTGTLHALDADDGSVVWTADAACVDATTGACAMATPAVAGGIVYVGSDEGEGSNESGALYAFDAMTGTPRWSAPTGIVQSSPAVANDKVYVSAATIDQVSPEAATDTLHVFDAASGDVAFTATIGVGRGVSSPTIFPNPGYPEGLVSAVALDGIGAVFDAAGSVSCSGSPTLCTPIRGTLSTPPVISSSAAANGVVFTGSMDGTLDLYTEGSNCPPLPDFCQPTRRLPVGAPSRSSPAVAAGWVYLGTDDGRVHAFKTFPQRLGLDALDGTFSGTGVFDFYEAGCAFTHHVFDADYVGSPAVGGVSLHLDVCVDLPSPLPDPPAPTDFPMTGTFTIDTTAGHVSGEASGFLTALTSPNPVAVTLTPTFATGAFTVSGDVVVDGTLFAGAAGVAAPFTGTVTAEPTPLP